MNEPKPLKHRSGRWVLVLLLPLFMAACSDTMPDFSDDDPESRADSDFPSLLTAAEKSRLESMHSSYDPSIQLLSGGTYLSTLEYVVLLFKSGEETYLERGETILRKIISAQVVDPSSLHYGNWPWGINQQVADRNPPVFFARRMLGQLWELQERMTSGTVNDFLLSCERLVVAAERRWDNEVWAVGRSDVAYTNVFALYTETLTLAGVRYNDDRLKSVAETQWTRFYNNFSVHGIDEFLSSDYDNITFNALWSIHQHVTDSRQKQEIKEVMDYIYLSETAVTHPVLNTQVVGISRDDRKFRNGSDARSEILKTVPEGYTPPPDAEKLKNRNYPFEVSGRAGAMTFTYHSYQLPNVAMGSMTGWGSYYCQQVHCMASVGTSTAARATLFIPGSYIHVNGFTDQKELSALCLYNRLPTLWHRTQWREDISGIGNTFFDFGVGLSTQWTEVSSETGHVVLRSRGYDVHVFPYHLKNGQVESSTLRKVSRTNVSEKYHRTDMTFDELLFPSDPLWFGVYIKIVPENSPVSSPSISFREENGLMVFTTDEGHRIRVAEADPGVNYHVQEMDPYELPRFSYSSNAVTRSLW